MFDLKTRILIVDDMVILRKQISRIFNELGYTDLVEATDGVEALLVIQHSKPPVGLVISDLEMPNANGIDLFKRIHGDTRFGKLPFIIMALEAEQASLVEAIKLGVHGYLIKPFNAEDLKLKLTELNKKLGN